MKTEKSQLNKTEKDKKEFLYLIIILLNFLVLAVVIFYILYLFAPKQDFCDYDSCFQEATSGNWNYSGSTCFDSKNPDCYDFLRFWRACQKYKMRMGIC